jgi:TonB family protein
MGEGAMGSGQLVASAGSGRSLGPAVSSMSAAIVPDRGSAMVSRVSDDSGTAPMQRVDAQAIAHQMENDRYEAKSLKVNSPKTMCELPLMMAGFDRKPLPEGLASIMGSESAMVMEAPPELLPGNLQPTYPPAALIGNLRGVVTIRAQVLTNGQVGEMFVRPPRAAGVLEQAAMETVRRWRFKPARRNGEPVSAWVNIPIEYRNPT